MSKWFSMVVLFSIVEVSALFSGEIFLVGGGVEDVILESLPATPISSGSVVGVDVSLDSLVPDVEYLALGACSDFSAIENLGRQIGRLLKSEGIDFWVFGSFTTISKDTSDILEKVSRSPFITAHVMAYLARGLQAAGVVPVFDFRKGYDSEVLNALVSRRAIYPFVVVNGEDADRISKAGFKRPYFVDMGKVWLLYNGNAIQLEYAWHENRPSDLKEARKEVLRKAIVLLKPETTRGKGKIYIDEIPEGIPQQGGVVIFADDEWLVELAREVLSGKESATGRKSW